MMYSLRLPARNLGTKCSKGDDDDTLCLSIETIVADATHIFLVHTRLRGISDGRMDRLRMEAFQTSPEWSIERALEDILDCGALMRERV